MIFVCNVGPMNYGPPGNSVDGSMIDSNTKSINHCFGRCFGVPQGFRIKEQYQVPWLQYC